MAWTEKDTPAPFDDKPIDGLLFLDGDHVSASMPWAKGTRRPVLAFPSGALCDLGPLENHENASVHIAGALKVPLYGTMEDALGIAREVGNEHGYDVEQQNDHTLSVSIDGDEQIHLLYDATTKRLSDVRYIRAGKAYSQSTALLIDADARLYLPDLSYPVLPSSYGSIKLALPELGWTWYPFAFDGEDMLFGLVCIDKVGLSSFSLSELAQLRSPSGFRVERDYDFEPTELRELKKHHAQRTEETPSLAQPTETIPAEAERLLTLKHELLTQFHQLPAEHQATMGVVMAQSILAGEWGTWFRDAMSARFGVGEQAVVPPYMLSVSREHLRRVHVSEEDMARLSDDDLRTIATLIHEHFITDAFWDELAFIIDLVLTGKQPRP